MESKVCLKKIKNFSDLKTAQITFLRLEVHLLKQGCSYLKEQRQYTETDEWMDAWTEMLLDGWMGGRWTTYRWINGYVGSGRHLETLKLVILSRAQWGKADSS